MKIDNVIKFTKQFNKEFKTKIKISNKDIRLLLNMFQEYIELTFKVSPVYNEILDKIVQLEEKLKNTRGIKSRKRTRGIVMREISNKNTSQRGAVK